MSNTLKELDALQRADEQRAQAEYGALTKRLASGENVAPTEARRILTAASATVAQLTTEVARLQSIIERQAEAATLSDIRDRMSVARAAATKLKAEIEARVAADKAALEASDATEARLGRAGQRRQQLADEIWSLGTAEERLAWGNRDAAIGLVRTA